MSQQVITSSVNSFGCYNMIACTSDIFESISDGSGTRSDCQSCYPSFKSGYALFKNSLSGVGQTAVDVSRVLQSEACGCMGGVVKYIRGGLVNRNCAGICCRVCLFLSYMNL